MSSSGSFKTSSYDGRYLLFSWEISNQSIANNSTTIAWKLTGAGTASVGYYKAGNFKVVIDGKTVYSSATRINLYNGTVVKTGTYTLNHSTDGTRTFSASAQAGIYTTAVNCTGSGSFTLNSIPRASTILSVSGNKITDKFSVRYSKAVSTYTDTLQINIEGKSVSQKIANYSSGAAFSLSNALKNDIYSVSKDSQSATLVFQLVTYNGTTKIGTSATIQKSVAINDSQPSIGDIIYEDANSKTAAITGNTAKIIRKYSRLMVIVNNVKAENGATISSIQCTIGDTTKTTSYTSSTVSTDIIDFGAVNVAGDSLLTVTVMDSRGNTAVASIMVTVCDYSKPTANITCKRRENFYTETDLTVNPYISDIFGKNTVTIKAQYKQADASSYSSAVTVASGSVTTLSLDNTKAWTVKVTVSDKLSSKSYVLFVAKGQPIIFLDRDKSSVGVNCFPSRHNSFEVDGKTIEDYISARIQSGSVSFNCAANTMVTQEITFTRAFAGKPRICLTANAANPQITHLAFVSASSTGFTLKYQSTIARNPAYVNWIAVLDDNSKPDNGE